MLEAAYRGGRHEGLRSTAVKRAAPKPHDMRLGPRTSQKWMPDRSVDKSTPPTPSLRRKTSATWPKQQFLGNGELNQGSEAG